jgi:hypothetical protein
MDQASRPSREVTSMAAREIDKNRQDILELREEMDIMDNRTEQVICYQWLAETESLSLRQFSRFYAQPTAVRQKRGQPT